MKYKFTLILIGALAMYAVTAAALPADSSGYNPVNAHFQLKSMYLWRGLELTTSPFMLATVNYSNRKENLVIGARGSAGFNGEYRQFDYFITYTHKRWKFNLMDIFNYSKTFPLTTNIFDYKPSTTRHFVDLTVAYTLSKKIPLDISWSTIIFGRDRDVLAGDTAANGKDAVRRGDNRYSTYLQLSYPVYNRNSTKIEIYGGGSFALNGKPQNFYATKASVVQIGIIVNQKIKLGPKYVLPVTITPIWNTFRKSGGVQLALALF